MLTTDRIKAVADPILRARLGKFGYESVDVREDRDEDDHAVLFLTGLMREDASFVPGDILNAAYFAVSNALLEAHEERFPHLVLARKNDEMPEIRPRRAS